MKKITFLIFLFFSVGCMQMSGAYAQQGTSSSLNENNPNSRLLTGVIFSVDPKNNGVNGVFLKEQDTEAQLYKLKGDCYRCEFYEGNIEGPFTVTSSGIKPEKKAVLTIHTTHNLMQEKVFNPGAFPPGSRFNLVRFRATVIDNQNGSFKLRIN